MKEHEIEKMLIDSRKPEDQPTIKLVFQKGEPVTIKEGPFQGYEGTVDELLPEKGLVRVLEEAAENLGASRWRVFRTVTLPLIAANVLAGAVLTFAFALLEVSDSLMLAREEKYFPITRAILGLLMRPDDGENIASPVGDYLHHGVELWVDAFDAPQVRLDDLYGRQLAVTNCAGQARGRCGRYRSLALNSRAHVMRLPHV